MIVVVIVLQFLIVFLVRADTLPRNPSMPNATEAEYDEFRKDQYPNVKCPKKEYDFIIVGAGAGGCVVANRLSEISSWSILLVEAGDYETRAVDIPGLTAYRKQLLQYKQIEWNFTSYPDPHAINPTNNRSHNFRMGLCVGGSTCHNQMLYTRGHQNNYNTWAEEHVGDDWNFTNVSRYFKKLENYHPDVASTDGFGHGGYVNVETPSYHSNLSTVLLESLEQHGEEIGNYNDPDQNGYGRVQGLTRDGFRFSANSAYLIPIRNKRPNLEMMINARVVHIITKNSQNNVTAIGIKVKRKKCVFTINARKEVILCAGPLNSPQLLMLSGIGPKTHLDDFQIPVVKNLPVGSTLFNQVYYPLKIISKRPIFPLEDYDLYKANPKSGPWTIPALIEILGFTGSSDKRLPLYEMHLFSTLPEFDKIKSGGFELFIIQTTPQSQGYVRLNSSNPLSKPDIFFTYLMYEEEINTIVEAIRELQAVLKQPAFQEWGVEILYETSSCDQFSKDSNEYWRCCILKGYIPQHHYSGSCKMGFANDSTAVVDPKLRVYGVNGLRVIDASVMPTMISGHTMAPTFMIGEKGSDFIKRYWLQRN